MNEVQRTILAVAVVALILSAVFLVPWRVEGRAGVVWGPVFREPIAYVRTYEYRKGGYRLESTEGQVDVGTLAAQVLAIVVLAGLGFVLAKEEPADSSRAHPEI